jgi:hypothetical protein
MKEVEKFADESDRASAIESAAIDIGIEAARIKAAKPEFEAVGACLNCGEKLEDGLRFCDADCRDDFILRNRNDR